MTRLDSKNFHILAGKKNKLVSKYQTQAVELKNAIKNITQNVSHFRGGGGDPRESETCLTFGQIFFSPFTGVPVLAPCDLYNGEDDITDYIRARVCW